MFRTVELVCHTASHAATSPAIIDKVQGHITAKCDMQKLHVMHILSHLRFEAIHCLIKFLISSLSPKETVELNKTA